MWYVIQVENGKEQSICDKCRRAFLQDSYKKVFVPQYVYWKKYLGEWHEETTALFSGYFFVDTEQPEKIESVLENLSRIARPVCVGDMFAPIRAEEQAFLERMMDAHHVILMSKGNLINGVYDIFQGPLKGITENIHRIDRHKRIAELTVNLWNRPRIMKVGLEIVQKIGCESIN